MNWACPPGRCEGTTRRLASPFAAEAPWSRWTRWRHRSSAAVFPAEVNAIDEAGRSAQQFVTGVVVRRGEEERRISAAGRDIYAATAPLVAEAARRLIDGRAKVHGAPAPGEVFDAADFLDALSPQHLTIRRQGPHFRG
jgi:hypothetical protein